MPEYRATFDAAVTFLNGGGLSAHGFRLDMPGPDASPDDVGALFVRHLGLLMVDRVDIANLEIIESHTRGRAGLASPLPASAGSSSSTT
jgi:arylformamidase